MKRIRRDYARIWIDFLRKGYDSRTGFSLATRTSWGCAVVWVEIHDPSPEPFPQHVGDKTEPRLNRCQKQENAEKWCPSRTQSRELNKNTEFFSFTSKPRSYIHEYKLYPTETTNNHQQSTNSLTKCYFPLITAVMSEVLSRMWNRSSVNPQMNMTPGARRPRLSAKNGGKHLNMRNVERWNNKLKNQSGDWPDCFFCLWVGARNLTWVHLGSTLTRLRMSRVSHNFWTFWTFWTLG